MVSLGAGILLAVLTMACAGGDGVGADTNPRGDGKDDPGQVAGRNSMVSGQILVNYLSDGTKIIPQFPGQNRAFAR